MLTKIETYQSPAFGSLFVSNSIKTNKNKNVANNYKAIEKIIADNKLDRKRNVDIILDYDNSTDKFYGIISSKKQGVPENPSNTREISTNKKDISIFKKWVNAWNKAYSKKELKQWRKLLAMVGQK